MVWKDNGGRGYRVYNVDTMKCYRHIPLKMATCHVYLAVRSGYPVMLYAPAPMYDSGRMYSG